MRRLAYWNHIHQLARVHVDHPHRAGEAEGHPQPAAVGGQLHIVRPRAQAGDVAHLGEGVHVENADGVGHTVAHQHMPPVGHGAEVVRRLAGDDALEHRAGARIDGHHRIAAGQRDQQGFIAWRQPQPGRGFAHFERPHHGLRGQVDGGHRIGFLQADVHRLAVGGECHVAGQRLEGNTLGEQELALVVAVDVHPVQAQAVHHEPAVIGRKTDLVGVGNIGHVADGLARLWVEQHEVAAHRVGDDQVLIVRRSHQVMRLLAGGKAADGLTGVLVDQGDAGVARIEHHHIVLGLRQTGLCQQDRENKQEFTHGITKEALRKARCSPEYGSSGRAAAATVTRAQAELLTRNSLQSIRIKNLHSPHPMGCPPLGADAR